VTEAAGWINDVEALKGVLACLDTRQYPDEGQFFTTTDVPALLLLGACGREVGRAELVGDFLMP